MLFLFRRLPASLKTLTIPFLLIHSIYFLDELYLKFLFSHLTSFVYLFNPFTLQCYLSTFFIDIFHLFFFISIAPLSLRCMLISSLTLTLRCSSIVELSIT